MGEPQTYEPAIGMDEDRGTITIIISTEGMSQQFDIAIDHAQSFCDQIMDLKRFYDRDKP